MLNTEKTFLSHSVQMVDPWKGGMACTFHYPQATQLFLFSCIYCTVLNWNGFTVRGEVMTAAARPQRQAAVDVGLHRGVPLPWLLLPPCSSRSIRVPGGVPPPRLLLPPCWNGTSSRDSVLTRVEQGPRSTAPRRSWP